MAEPPNPAPVLPSSNAGEQTSRGIAQELRRDQELLQLIFDTVPLMMTIYEPDTRVLRVNRAFERLIGWSTEELANVSLMEECYPDPAYREQARVYMQACLPEWRDFRVRTRYGADIESSWTNVRLSDNTQLGIGIDITERNRAERALRASEEALRRANRLKDEFLATLAHELRNPLSPMLNAVELLRMRQEGDTGTRKVLGVLDRQLGVMVRLVNDLLDISRVNTGKVDLLRARVDLKSIVLNAVENGRQLDVAKGLQVALDMCGSSLTVDGDSVRLEQVFSNLLNNACKFTPAGGRVRVSLERQGDEAIVRVSDSGIGMTTDVLPHVFETFMQADRRIDRAHQGLGIGLSLVKQLVDLHGGSVTAASQGTDRGSEFVVRLPLAIETPPLPHRRPTGEAAALDRSAGKRLRTLVVDDNADAADTLAQLLVLAGHEAYASYAAPAGIEMAKLHRVEAIVMDLGMPGISGYDAARIIRADPELCHITLIALSGWGQEQARRNSAEAGFDHHLVKPVDISSLAGVLRRRT